MAAYAIDLILLYTPIAAALAYGEMRLRSFLPVSTHVPFGIGAWGISILIPAVVVGMISGMTGRTPGKLLMFLKVQDHSGSPPGIARASSGKSSSSSPWASSWGSSGRIQGMIARGQTFYDEWMDIEVEDLNPVGLTPTHGNDRLRVVLPHS